MVPMGRLKQKKQVEYRALVRVLSRAGRGAG
jgi:hypothetical protein